MNQRYLFKKLGAPLANQQWSWGAVRASDGAVFLRVWQDEEREHGASFFMRLTHHAAFATNRSSQGYRERVRHVELVRSGAPCYLIVCVAADVMASPRSIRSFDEKSLLVGGAVMEFDGDSWIERVRRVPSASLAPRPNA